MSIQRYTWDAFSDWSKSENGDMVRYADHVAAMHAEYERSYNEAVDDMMSATIRLENKRIRDEGYAAGVQAAHNAVAACESWVCFEDRSVAIDRDTAIAAIDALRGEQA